MMRLLLLLALLVAAPALGEVVYVARDEEGKVVELTDERCALPGVSNLGRRAVWREPGKVHEGCWRIQSGIVVTYWDDRSIIVIPSQVFTKVTNL